MSARSHILCGSGRRPRFRLLSALVAAFAAPGVFALNPDEKPANYLVAHWDTEDGLPHNKIRQILQARDGFLWVGTQQGLARFDGLAFTIFDRHNTPAMRSSLIVSLAETGDGSLWIGTNMGLVRYSGGQFTAYSKADGLKSDVINALCVAPDGSLWIGGREGVVRWVGGRFVSDIDTSAYDTFGMRNITVDRQNALWLAIGSGALRYRDGAFTFFGRTQGLPAAQLQSIREDPDGQIIAVTQDGLLRLEGERFVPLALNDALSSRRVNRTLSDRAGNLWIGSVEGLERYAGDSLVPYADLHGAKPGVVDVLLEDREANLWFGTSSGLYRLSDRRAYSLAREDGIPGSLVMSVNQTRDGSLWVSSWGAGVVRFQNGASTRFTAGSPLSHDSVSAIYEAPDGTMWFGNLGSSIDRWDGHQVTTYVYQSGVASSRPVTALLADDDGSLLAAISSRGLLQLRDGQLSPVPEAAALARAVIWSIYRTTAGRLLLGTDNGVYERLADRTWVPVAFPTLKAPVIVRNFLEADGNVWLATDGHGLVRWRGGEARAFGTREGLVDDTLHSVVDDGQGALWVGSARGLGRIRKSELAAINHEADAVVECVTFGRVDGLLSASTSGIGRPTALRLADGRVLTATDNGVAVIDLQLLRVNRQPPTVMIEGILADERRLVLPPGGEAILAAGTFKVEFRYTALSLSAPQRLRFRYQLEGFDSRWIEAGHDRRAHYTRLAPGHYRFRVLACNSDGVWNETGDTLAVTMLAHYYQTLWFRLTAFALLGGALAGAVGLRLRQGKLRAQALGRANAELDQRVRERTKELARERARFKFIFDSVPVGFTWMVQHQLATRMVNPAQARITGVPAERCRELELYRLATHPDDRARQDALHQRLQAGEIDHYNFEKRYVHGDGSIRWTLFSVHLYRDATGDDAQEICTLVDITERIQVETQLEQTYKQLMVTSRQAGMAEVATSVLHNVGNTLNSLNISATLVAELVGKSRLSSLAKVAGLLREHAADLGAFLHDDPKGRHLPAFLEALASHLGTEHATMLQELHSLRKNVDHIKDIISMQQNYARISGVVETVALSDLAEDALRMNASALAQHDVTVVRDYQAQIKVVVEQHKVLQILVNLIRNAWFACGESSRSGKQITVRITGDGRRAQIAISDNGIGIPPENLMRIFNHGFTTRKDGHGFGLHSCALAAKELGGSLTVQSDGSGLGATFILELPLAVPAPDTGNPIP